MALNVSVSEGDIRRLPNPRGDDFIVEVLKVFTYKGEEYADVKPVDFDGCVREVKTCMLFY